MICFFHTTSDQCAGVGVLLIAEIFGVPFPFYKVATIFPTVFRWCGRRRRIFNNDVRYSVAVWYGMVWYAPE